MSIVEFDGWSSKRTSFPLFWVKTYSRKKKSCQGKKKNAPLPLSLRSRSATAKYPLEQGKNNNNKKACNNSTFPCWIVETGLLIITMIMIILNGQLLKDPYQYIFFRVFILKIRFDLQKNWSLQVRKFGINWLTFCGKDNRNNVS